MPIPSLSHTMVGHSRRQKMKANMNRFMPADALWTFAMACNVWLSFFRSYDAVQLRRLEWKYCVACYGLPFIPAFIYLFISTPGRGKVYGSATVSDLKSEMNQLTSLDMVLGIT